MANHTDSAIPGPEEIHDLKVALVKAAERIADREWSSHGGPEGIALRGEDDIIRGFVQNPDISQNVRIPHRK